VLCNSKKKKKKKTLVMHWEGKKLPYLNFPSANYVTREQNAFFSLLHKSLNLLLGSHGGGSCSSSPFFSISFFLPPPPFLASLEAKNVSLETLSAFLEALSNVLGVLSLSKNYNVPYSTTKHRTSSSFSHFKYGLRILF
jgi:hypothetical protein